MDDTSIRIYKGSYIMNEKEKDRDRDRDKAVKCFVFDLDETLGSFTDLDVIWRGLIQLKSEHKNFAFQETQETFNQLLGIYPEFLRYGIITMFEFLYHKKQMNKCHNIYIYTNNQCSPSWPIMISKYIETVGKCKNLFKMIIRAFKIHGTIVEENRTTHSKTPQDLFRCTLLPKTSEICFIDDSYFPKMKHKRIFYIQPKPYYHSLNLREIMDRLIKSNLGQGMNIEPFEHILHDWCIASGCSLHAMIKTMEEKQVDIMVSQKIMYFLKDFFYMGIRNNKTRKNRRMIWQNTSKKVR